MNRRIFSITVGILVLVAAMLIMGAGGASATLNPSTFSVHAQSMSQLQQPDAPLAPVTTTFTYQGYLAESGNPASGQYDFEFRLFDALTGGNQLGGVSARPNEAVSSGVFTVPLDFGVLDGTAGWLEIKVRRVGGSFITLAPRQRITPALYAITLKPGAIISGTLNGGRGQLADTLLVYNNSISNITYAIRGVSAGGGSKVAALKGESSGFDANGVFGSSSGDNGKGVFGRIDGDNGRGVSGLSTGSGGVGVLGFEIGAGDTGYGVYGLSVHGIAGRFDGNVDVTGNLSKGGGSFKIDHPLDPANKYLYHSFVESPDMMNIYNGNISTDAKGEAVVKLPDWFEALNKDFRYQLTPIGQFAQVIVGEEVKGNRFTIKSDKPNVKVSWQVTGIRKDAYAEAHRIPVEEAKEGDEKGKYLYPEELGQPESKGIEYERIQRLRADSEAQQPKP
jgi:hypothetical protein